MKWQLQSQHVVGSAEETKRLAEIWAQTLTAPVAILLEGPMGVGKTQWVRASVESLGGKWVSSPSFAVIQRYATRLGPIDHADLFRLKNPADLESTGFWDLFDEAGLILFAEWPERVVENHWPRSVKLIRIEFSFCPRTARGTPRPH